jgi:hypothetical protein
MFRLAGYGQDGCLFVSSFSEVSDGWVECWTLLFQAS